MTMISALQCMTLEKVLVDNSLSNMTELCAQVLLFQKIFFSFSSMHHKVVNVASQK